MKIVSRDHPLVSIMMPCYNARQSLPWAISSCLAQTYDNWELVLVDDGSIDHPEEVVEQANDHRIRLIRLPENRGRGFARQVALDKCRGEFICMLDADDWMYPDRIEQQVKLLERHLEIELVSSGLAICDRNQSIVGVRSTGDGQVQGPHTAYTSPVAHASSMFRGSAKERTRYDADLKFGEDSDFLARVLFKRHYLVTSLPLYAYGELESVSARKAAAATKFERVRIRKNVGPGVDRYRILAISYIKEAAYRCIDMVRMDNWALTRRNRRPSLNEEHRHRIAYDVVRDVYRKRFTV